MIHRLEARRAHASQVGDRLKWRMCDLGECPFSLNTSEKYIYQVVIRPDGLPMDLPRVATAKRTCNLSAVE